MAHQDKTWTTPPDHQGHQVNASGQVRNVSSGKVMQMSVNQTGVQYVSIRNTTTGRYENVTVAVLVASTFCPGRSTNENTVLHKDGNSLNNHADNLMWATRWHTIAYHQEIADGRHDLKRRIQDSTGRIYPNILSAAMATGTLPSAIDYAVRYNQTLAKDEHVNFVHKVWPGGHVFTQA